MSDRSPDTVPANVADEFPVTTTQQRCWFLDQIEPGNTALHIAVRWEIRGPIATVSLQRAFQLVTDRHEILRTRLVARDGEPVQQVVPELRFRLGELDLRTTPEGDRMARIDAIARAEGGRAFDLGQPGLLRATLVRFEAERAMLLITAHQSIFDGHSIGVLGHEIGTAAAAFEAGEVPDLPALSLQFGDFALWQAEYLASGVLEEEGAWWQEILRDAPYFELPTDKPRPPQQDPAVRELHLDLPEADSTALHDRARQADVTPFTFAYAVVVACLHRLTGAGDILLGTQTAGRTDVDLDPLIGVFINNLVLRLAAAPETTIAEHVTRAREVIEGALAHQTIPFNRLVERLNPVRDAARNPLISMNFNLMNVFMQGRRHGEFELVSIPSHYPGAVYDMQVMMVGRPTGWRLIVQYQTALFEAETMERMLHQLHACLRAALAEPQMRLADLPLDPVLAERLSGDDDSMRALEQCLGAHPLVDEVAVMAEGGRICAFVTPGQTGVIGLETLPERLMRHVADTPGVGALDGISVLAGFPRTSQGDINRSLLRMPKRGTAPAAREAAAPDPRVEKRLRAVWREILSVSEVPPDATFFDLGGHSLLAVRLLSRIGEEWGLRLGIAEIYGHATLPELAGLVSERLGVTAELPADDWQILRLKDDGAERPLISINSAALPLATVGAMSAPRPAICVRLFDDTHEIGGAPRRFEDYAADYAALVRRAQPEGPYLLYGNCVHGNLALEAARLLKADGAEVAVVMKDVWEPGFADAVRKTRGARWQDRRHALRNRIRLVREGTLSLSAALGSYGIVRRSGVLHLAAAVGLIDRVRSSDLEEVQERVILEISEARNAYLPEPLDLPVLHVVTAITPRGGHFLPSIGWEKVVTGPLRTVFIEEVRDHPAPGVGIDAFVREIETFLQQIDAAR